MGGFISGVYLEQQILGERSRKVSDVLELLLDSRSLRVRVQLIWHAQALQLLQRGVTLVAGHLRQGDAGDTHRKIIVGSGHDARSRSSRTLLILHHHNSNLT